MDYALCIMHHGAVWALCIEVGGFMPAGFLFWFLRWLMLRTGLFMLAIGVGWDRVCWASCCRVLRIMDRSC